MSLLLPPIPQMLQQTRKARRNILCYALMNTTNMKDHDPRFNSTYYGKDYRAGAALLRARRPYLFRNAITGISLVAFTISVCTFKPRCDY